MGTVLSILDLLVLLLLVISVARAVWNDSASRLFSGLVVLAMLVFGLVSSQGLLFVDLAVIVILSRAFWRAPTQ